MHIVRKPVSLAVLAVLLAPTLALAGGPDVSAVTAAGTTALAYAAAVAGVLVSIWAAKLAYRKFFGG